MQPDSSQFPPQPARRDFFKTAAGVLLLKPKTVFGTEANSAVEVGLIGCGGRGNWIGAFFPEFAGARIVALADVIRERLDATQSSFKVDPSRTYYGPEAYRELDRRVLSGVRRRAHRGPGRCYSRAPGCHAIQLQSGSLAHLLRAGSLSRTRRIQTGRGGHRDAALFPSRAGARRGGRRQTRLS